MASLGNFGSNYSTAFALNASGVVVGEAGLSSGEVHGFVFATGTLTDIGTLGGAYSTALAINDSGAVVGESAINSSDDHGFVYAGGTMTDLGTLGGTYSVGMSINRAGQILGLASTANDLEYHAFVYTAAMTDLGTLGGDFSYGVAINNLGQVVGESTTAEGALHAFLWQNGTMIDLNNLLPSNSGWELTGALFINDSGRIVGFGNHDGLSQWFILDLASANQPPVAVAGPNQIVECDSAAILNGTGSSDPDGTGLAFEWSLSGTVLSIDPVLSTSLPMGTNVLTLKVTDPCGASAQASVTVVVVDSTQPIILSSSAPINVSADANGNGVVPDVLSALLATDNCTPANQLRLAQSPAAGTVLPYGNYSIGVSVLDASGNRTSMVIPFKIVDTTSPVIRELVADPSVLSPPNHQLVPVTISAAVTDNCDAAPLTKIISVSCNEVTSPSDIQITGNLTVTLAASKSASGNARMYTITVQSTDASGNKSSALATVTVPKSNGTTSSVSYIKSH
jgi:probable HAF family extracellular repeat protein